MEWNAFQVAGCFGGPAGIRTLDPKIKSLVLYQLSYRPTVPNARDPAPVSRGAAFCLPSSALSRPAGP